MEDSTCFDLLMRDCSFENTKTVLPVIRKCITTSQNETLKLRAFEVALCCCLKNMSFDELEEELFQMTCPAAKGFVLQKLKHSEKNPSDCSKSLEASLKIIAYFREAIAYLYETSKIHFKEVKSLLIATCEILFSCYSHCKISEEVYGSFFSSVAEFLRDFFKKCCTLQEGLLNFITEKVQCDTDDKRDLEVLDEVMSHFSKSGIVLIYLEVKMMAKVWKTFVCLMERYISYINIHTTEDTIRDLSFNIITNVESILYKDNQDIIRIIKLSCFLIKLVIKLSNISEGNLKNCQQALLSLLLFFCKCDVDAIKWKENINQELMNQLTTEIDPLLTQLLNDKEFVRECSAVSQDPQKAAEFSLLCCLIMEKLINSATGSRSLWFNERESIMEWIFIAASSSEFMTCSNERLPRTALDGNEKKFMDLYEYVLVTTSAFAMTADSDEYRFVERTLINSVLQKSLIRALLAVDTWCLLASSAGLELCLSQLLTLCKIFQEFLAGTCIPEKWYLGSLIRRLFPLLTTNHRETFLRSFPPTFYSALWEGRPTEGLTPEEAHEVCRPLVDLLGQDVTDSFEIERPMSRQSLLYRKLGKKIVGLWKFDCNALPSGTQKVKFFKIVCGMTACVVSDMPSESLSLVLSQMKQLLTMGQSTGVKVSFTWILNSLASVRIPGDEHQKKILATIAEIFRILLSSKDPICKQKALETFFSFSHLTTHGEIISMSAPDSPELKQDIANFFKRKPPNRPDFDLNDFIRELYRMSFEHVCHEPEFDGGSGRKRIKMGFEDFDGVAARWKEDGIKIVESFNFLSDSQKREIRNVCHSILSLP